MTPMRANVVGPPSVATSIRASIAACRSGAVCSAFGSFRAAESIQGRCCRHCPPCCRRAKSSARHRDRVGAGRAIPGWVAWIDKLSPPVHAGGFCLEKFDFHEKAAGQYPAASGLKIACFRKCPSAPVIGDLHWRAKGANQNCCSIKGTKKLCRREHTFHIAPYRGYAASDG
jgi:hypothetical protein